MKPPVFAVFLLCLPLMAFSANGSTDSDATCLGRAQTAGVSRVYDAAAGVWRITGTMDADVIVGTSGNDIILGRGGADIICGLAGSDHLDGANGPDTLIGGDGFDLLDGGNGTDLIIGGNGNDTVRAGPHIDEIHGGPGDDNIDASAGHDLVYGGSGDDYIMGRYGRDLLFGQTGDDYLNGGGLADELNGGAGQDTVIGNVGNDTCTGIDTPDVIRNCESRVWNVPDNPLDPHRCEIDVEGCKLHDGTTGPTVLIIGDSHVGMSLPIFEDWAQSNDLTLYAHSLGSCGWIRGVTRGENWEHDKFLRCIAEQHTGRPAMIEAIEPDMIVLFSRVMDTHPSWIAVNPDTIPSGRTIQSHAVESLQYYRSVADQVVVIESLPVIEEAEENPAVCLAAGRVDCDFVPVDYPSNTTAAQVASEQATVDYVSWTELVCPDGNCPARIDGLDVRSDGNHLTEQMVEHMTAGAVDILNQVVD